MGFTTPLRAINLAMDHPKLFALSIAPMAVTLIVLSCLIYALLAGAWGASHLFFNQMVGSYANALSGVTVFFVAVFALYFSFNILNLLLALFSSPFNDFLAEATERACGEVATPHHFLDLFRVFALDLRKTILAFALVILMTLISFAPLIGFFSFVGFSFIQAFTFITYPQSRRKHGIVDSLRWIKNNGMTSFGFGLVTLLLFGIPFLNIFALPLSVIGGTLLYLRK